MVEENETDNPDKYCIYGLYNGTSSEGALHSPRHLSEFPPHLAIFGIDEETGEKVGVELPLDAETTQQMISDLQSVAKAWGGEDARLERRPFSKAWWQRILKEFLSWASQNKILVAFLVLCAIIFTAGIVS
jgi:hypothetical protein